MLFINQLENTCFLSDEVRINSGSQSADKLKKKDKVVSLPS